MAVAAVLSSWSSVASGSILRRAWAATSGVIFDYCYRAGIFVHFRCGKKDETTAPDPISEALRRLRETSGWIPIDEMVLYD
jgi:hypothetical protein